MYTTASSIARSDTGQITVDGGGERVLTCDRGAKKTITVQVENYRWRPPAAELSTRQ